MRPISAMWTGWLTQKAKEDAEYQKQIRDYAAQGITASVVENDNAKWAVYAKSSVSGRQGFFAYYAPRKLVVGDAPEPEKPTPPAGDADITLKKVAGWDDQRFGWRQIQYLSQRSDRRQRCDQKRRCP